MVVGAGSVVVVGGTVVATVVVAAGSVVGTVVSGRVVSGEVVSTVGCVSGGGGGVVAATVEEVVEVDVVELVCSTVLVVVDSSVDVVVGSGNEPHHCKESNSQRSHSAGSANPVIALPAFAVTTTVASQQVPSIGLPSVVPSL